MVCESQISRAKFASSQVTRSACNDLGCIRDCPASETIEALLLIVAEGQRSVMCAGKNQEATGLRGTGPRICNPPNDLTGSGGGRRAICDHGPLER